ncbi:hypothetical protein AU476_21110 [Cupriavidus sp. UYMSc13B]|nr:hypothetical protein AU476_21110 [Cupriavidus sp. UYMSc13B]
MTVYFVAGVKNPQALWAKVEEVAPEEKRYRIADDKFFVNFEGTSASLSEKLGIKDGSVGTGLILRVGGYNGRLPTSAWEWLSANLEK